MDIIQGCWKSIRFDWRITCGVCFSLPPFCPRFATLTLPRYYFAVALVVVVQTSKKYLSFFIESWLWYLRSRFYSRAKLRQGKCILRLPSPLMKTWPVRNESPLRSVLSALCTHYLELSRLFGLRSLTPPSPFALNISWKGWCWACACSSKLILPIFIPDSDRMIGHVNQRLHPCARLPPAVSQASWLSFVRHITHWSLWLQVLS